jgi:hypothetical protein
MQRHEFLNRAPGNNEKMLAIGLREATVAFGNVGWNGKGCPVQLINKETVSPRELLRSGADIIGKVERLLVNQ